MSEPTPYQRALLDVARELYPRHRFRVVERERPPSSDGRSLEVALRARRRARSRQRVR